MNIRIDTEAAKRMVNFKVLLATLLTLSLSFGFLQQTYADDSLSPAPAEPQSIFVDLDGDGFDDNAIDQDGDGIPDEDSPSTPAAVNSDSNSGGMFSSLELVVPRKPAFLRNSGSFGYSRSRALALVAHRGGFGFGNSFGPGNDIGSGAVLGSMCAGGVCVPH